MPGRIQAGESTCWVSTERVNWLWLNDSWLRGVDREIKCLRLQPHVDGGEVLVETSVVIPLPEAADYQTQLGELEKESRSLGSARSRLVIGNGSFKDSIGEAEKRFQSELTLLYEHAVRMADKNIVELHTYINRKGDYLRLELRTPGTHQYLASFNNLLFGGGIGEISFWPGWEQHAPKSIDRINELVGPVKSPSGVRHRRLSTRKTSGDLDRILAVIDQAYGEASTETPDGLEPPG